MFIFESLAKLRRKISIRALAAVAGGGTSVVMMANTNPVFLQLIFWNKCLGVQLKNITIFVVPL